MKLTSLRIILTIGAALDLEIHQLDVKMAFLNGEIDTDIYIDQPEGYKNHKYPNLVCKLRKGLYGLKQSPRLWNKKIDEFLKKNDFKQCLTDPCIYHQQFPDKNDIVILSIWVDDILIIALPNRLETIKQILKTEYKMTDLGPISFILGISIIRNRKTRQIKLHQPRHIKAALERFNMENANISHTPTEPSKQLQKATDSNIPNPNTPYRQAIGSLMYIALSTRPDIATALNKAAQHSINHDESHWIAVKRIFRYLKGTFNLALTLGNTKNNDMKLTAACDSDWAGDTDDRKSTTGYLFFLNDGLISWQSRKQNTVATSSTQAEYHALSGAAKETLWIRQFLNEIGQQQQCATTILQDNQSTIALAYNPIIHNRTKHIDVIHHHIRELIEQQEITLEYRPTNEMPADAMTKALPRLKFEQCREAMRILEV